MKEVSSLRAEIAGVVSSSDSLLQQNGDLFVFLRKALAHLQEMDRDRGLLEWMHEIGRASCRERVSPYV